MNELNNDIIVRLFDYVERRAFMKGVVFASSFIAAVEILRRVVEKKKAEEE